MTEKFYENIIHFIDRANSILLTTHEFPDADGLGSQIALCEALQKRNKSFKAINEEALIQRYHYLDPSHYITSYQKQIKQNPQEQWDLAIVIDTNKPERCGPKIHKLLSQVSTVIFIDHHPMTTATTENHFINTQAAATGQLVGELIEHMGMSFSIPMSVALYTAILIDTNSFRYPSVTADTHRLIAKLLDTGMSSHRAYNMVYGTRKIDQMHLLGHILQNTQSNQAGSLAWIYIKATELKKFHSHIEDTHAYINNLLSLEGIKVACMFREEGQVLKLSLRSHGDIDVGEIAGALGGGGHSHSAATQFLSDPSTRSPKEIMKQALNTIEEFLNS